MISVCTVICGPCKRYLDIYKNSIVNRTKHINEVLICDIDKEPDCQHEEIINGIKFIYFSIPPTTHAPLHTVGHSYGLHECIKRANEDYVLLCDPDIFFYKGADEFYLDLYNKYNLTFIGITHHNAIQNCNGFFPYIGNLLIKKEKLPNDNFLNEFKRIPNKYLLPGGITEIMHLYPKPDGACDTGFHLWYWHHLTQCRWLSFQTLDVHAYTSRIYRASFKITEKLPKKKFVWHATGGGSAEQPYWDEFQKAYEHSILEETENDYFM